MAIAKVAGFYREGSLLRRTLLYVATFVVGSLAVVTLMSLVLVTVAKGLLPEHKSRSQGDKAAVDKSDKSKDDKAKDDDESGASEAAAPTGPGDKMKSGLLKPRRSKKPPAASPVAPPDE